MKCNIFLIDFNLQQIFVFHSSGCIGADNLDEKDNQKEPFYPYTIKRVNIPRYSETGQ